MEVEWAEGVQWTAWKETDKMPSANITEAIDGLTTAIQGIDTTFLLLVLVVLSVALTWAMFQSRSVMLGFPCLIFWAILGGYCYQQSTTTWDIYYLLFFGSFGMAIFCAFAAYALRTKKEEAEEGDLYFDEGGDNDVKFIDEGGGSKDTNDGLDEDGAKPSRRTREIRDRASRRRTRWE